MARKTLSSDVITRAYLDSLLLEVRHLDSVMPSTEFKLYGRTFKSPIMTAALSHLYEHYPDGMTEMARGATAAGAVTWSGMGEDDELTNMIETGASVIKIIKPYADRDLVLHRIQHAAVSDALPGG